MTIEADVILDPILVNEWLDMRGLSLEHPVKNGAAVPVPADATVLERNDLISALLGRHGHGAANILLAAHDGHMMVVPLALLEHVVEAMRDIVGPDPRLMSTGEAEYVELLRG